MSSKRTTKSKKQRIELLTTCHGWERGYVTKILSQDKEFYYFNDEWGRFSTIEKNKEGIEFLIVGKEYPKADRFMCGGREVTYNRLMKKAEEIRKSQE